MGYDFNQFLKRYVHVIDINNYDEDKDRLFLDKVNEVLDNITGEGVIELVILNKNPDATTYSSLYATYDKVVHPLSDEYVLGIVRQVIVTMSGTKLGDS